MKKTQDNSASASFGREERSSTTTTAIKTGSEYDLIKLALDVHKEFVTVARQIDNAMPERPRNLRIEEFLEYAAEQLKRAKKVASCYEVGCFGFVLHRQLTKLGVQNFTLAPAKLERNKTDRIDSAAMLVNLDRYLAGNKKAMSVVRVPTEAEERTRALARQRDSFATELRRVVAQGRSHLLYCGVRVSGAWYLTAKYTLLLSRIDAECSPETAEHLKQFLTPLRETAEFLQGKLNELTREERKRNQQRRPEQQEPSGMGPLMMEKIESEICDWNRFSNRRQVASYTGLCPRVQGSGGKFTNFSIDKHGNTRLRAALIELAWLMVHYQPGYGPVKRWEARVLKDPKATRSARKKAIVAIARQLAVDLWRLRTGKTSEEKLELRPPVRRRVG